MRAWRSNMHVLLLFRMYATLQHISCVLRRIWLYVDAECLTCFCTLPTVTFGMTSPTMYYYTKVMSELFLDAQFEDTKNTYRGMTTMQDFWRVINSLLCLPRNVGTFYAVMYCHSLNFVLNVFAAICIVPHAYDKRHVHLCIWWATETREYVNQIKPLLIFFKVISLIFSTLLCSFLYDKCITWCLPLTLTLTNSRYVTHSSRRALWWTVCTGRRGTTSETSARRNLATSSTRTNCSACRDFDSSRSYHLCRFVATPMSVMFVLKLNIQTAVLQVTIFVLLAVSLCTRVVCINMCELVPCMTAVMYVLIQYACWCHIVHSYNSW